MGIGSGICAGAQSEPVRSTERASGRSRGVERPAPPHTHTLKTDTSGSSYRGSNTQPVNDSLALMRYLTGLDLSFFISKIGII